MNTQPDIANQLTGLKKKALRSGIGIGIAFACLLYVQGDGQNIRIISAVLGFTIGFPIGYFGYLKRAKQKAHISIWAKEHGWTMLNRLTPEMLLKKLGQSDDSPSRWYNLSRSRRCWLTQCCEKDIDGRVAIIGKLWHKKGNDSEETAFIAIPVDGSINHLLVHPHHILDKFNMFLKLKVAEFESSDFNKLFTVRSEMQGHAFEAMTPSAMEALMEAKTLHMEIRGNLLIADMPRWTRLGAKQGQKEILNEVIRTHGRDFADELLLLSIVEAFLGATSHEICRPVHGFAPEDSPVQFHNQK